MDGFQQINKDGYAGKPSIQELFYIIHSNSQKAVCSSPNACEKIAEKYIALGLHDKFTFEDLSTLLTGGRSEVGLGLYYFSLKG
jgi:hypothetical protein